MTLADYSLAAFALLNGGRTVAYVPQMVRVYRDPHGATAVSLTTWLLFAAANIATVAYALAVADDRLVAFVFGLNAVGCLAIVALTAIMRARATQRAMLAAQVASLQCSAQLVADETLRDNALWRDTPSARVRDEMIRQGGLS